MIAFGLFLLYHSIYFKKLDDFRRDIEEKQFDAYTYAHNFWQTHLLPEINQAIEITTVLPLLSHNFKWTIQKYGKTLGLGSEYYLMIKGIGLVKQINDKEVNLEVLINGKLTKI